MSARPSPAAFPRAPRHPARSGCRLWLRHIARTDPENMLRSWHVRRLRKALGQQLHAAQYTAPTEAGAATTAAAAQQGPQQFQQWAAREDEKVDKLLASETPERRTAIQQEAAAILREDGIDRPANPNIWNNDPTFRSATSQKLLDAGGEGPDCRTRCSRRQGQAGGPRPATRSKRVKRAATIPNTPTSNASTAANR